MNWFAENSIAFLSPWWLLLLLVLPWVIWQSLASMTGLGPVRRGLAIALRSTIILLMVSALADLQWVKRSEKFCTYFVLDYSQSVPNDPDDPKKPNSGLADRALKAVADAISSRANLNDEAGVIVFGKDARIELPAAEYPKGRPPLRSITAPVDRQHTNIAAGIKLALGSFPPDSARRIVVLSDGNQNAGNALSQALAAQQDIGGKAPIDVVPLTYKYDSEILVDKVTVPPDLKKGDTANLKVMLRSAKAANGVLKLVRASEAGRSTVLEQRVQLQEGLSVFAMKQTIDAVDTYTFEAEFVPDPDSGDKLARNNRRSGFTTVRGKGRVLLIEPARNEFSDLAGVLRQESLEVVQRTPDELRETIASFRSFDGIIVANVPAERLLEPMQELLVANCRDLGAGLMMIGGPDSFGAGGYKNSPIEKALPVDMEVKSTKVRGKGALVLLMHGCEIPEGNRWEKDMAILALDKLGPDDECGLLGFNATSGKMEWVFNLQRVGNGVALKRLVNRMQPMDMPDFEPGMQMALTALTKTDAMSKHCIVMSDGDPQPPTNGTLNSLARAKITCSTVAIAAHGGTERNTMGRMARITKGRFYEVTNPKTLPQIYITETRLISRPLIYEKDNPFEPKIRTFSEPISGLAPPLPPIRGLVLTSPKERAEIPVVSPYPPELEVVPVVAHWQYNLGRSVAVTTDAGKKWASGWVKTPMYRKFWSQLVRWMLRPSENEDLSVAMQEKDGEVTVVVNAVDKNSQFMNFMKLKGSLIQPVDANGKVPTANVDFRQTEPGKYEAKFQADAAGSYFLSIAAAGADGKATLLSTGLDISYPPEFRDLESNRDLLENIAQVSGGRVIELNDAANADFFPRSAGPAYRLSDAWPNLLLIALCLLFADVAIRRIAVEPAEVAAVFARAYRKMTLKKVAETTPTMERLKTIKASMEEQLKGRRFEIDPASAPTGEVTSALDELNEKQAARPAAPIKPVEKLGPSAESKTEDTPFGRLLKAKQDALKKRQEERDAGN